MFGSEKWGDELLERHWHSSTGRSNGFYYFLQNPLGLD